MKLLVNLVLSLALTGFLSLQAHAQNPDLHIYLAFGQSNMEGMGDIAAQDSNTDPRFNAIQSYDCQSNLGRSYGEWYTATPPLFGCWGKLSLADSFGREMIKHLPEHISIAIVPTAVGGADIAVFQKGAPVGKGKYGDGKIPGRFAGGYDWLVDLAKKAQEKGVIKGIILHQGETNNNQNDWKDKVAGIVDNLKQDLNLGDIPLLAGETLHGGCCDNHNKQIAKLPSVMNAHVISAQGLDGVDVAHFSADAYRTFGTRYAEKMLELVEVTTDLGCGSDNQQPICCQNSSDDDGDGLGLEQGVQCKIDGSAGSSSSGSSSSSASGTSASEENDGNQGAGAALGLLQVFLSVIVLLVLTFRQRAVF